MPTLPLEGIRVLDLGISTAGPYAARFLGDLGAEVIKVEPLDGENSRKLGLRFGGEGYLFHVNNHNKKSLSLRVQHAKGRSLFLDLVARSHVVIENFAVGTMDGWGIGYDACRTANPEVIYCSAKGFGNSGPWRGKRAFDTVVQGLSGIMDATGRPGDPPVKGGPSVCDLMTAAVSVMAINAALHARRPGTSQLLDTALFDMGAWSLLWLWPFAGPDREATRHVADGHPVHAPFGRFECRDGEIMVTVTTDAQWSALAPQIGLPAEWPRPIRKSKEAEIDRALGRWSIGRSAEPAASELQQLGVPAGAVLDLEQVANSGQIEARGLLGTVDHPVFGKVPLIRTPLMVADTGRPDIQRLQPTLGEHNDEIVGGLLGRGAEIAVLRAEGVLG